jgi:hypothetical protein
MTTCVEQLHALLSEDGREVRNFKFFLGSEPTADGVCLEAARVIKSARARGMVFEPPHSGVVSSTL